MPLLVFVAGILFALGLGVSGMTDPEVVLAFLNVRGAWSGSLAGVMVGAIATHGVLRRWGLGEPLVERQAVDAPLLLGAVLFGVGWGLSGFCPGPALVGVVAGDSSTWAFVGAMGLGIALAESFKQVRSWQHPTAERRDPAAAAEEPQCG